MTQLVHDTIFARSPGRFNESCVFIGGRDIDLAAEMFDQARQSMSGPFQVSLLADPNGAYTTSVALIILLEKGLNRHYGQCLKGSRVTVFGCGPVGLCTAILAAKQGAKITLCGLTSDDQEDFCLSFCARYGVSVTWRPALTSQAKQMALNDAHVAISAAKSGIRVLGNLELKAAERLQVLVDTNAVGPSGIELVDSHDEWTEKTFGNRSIHSLGAIPIGKAKYLVQYGLASQIQTAQEVCFFDFPEAVDYGLSLFS